MNRFTLPALALAIAAPAFASVAQDEANQSDPAARALFQEYVNAWNATDTFSARVQGQASGIFQSVLGPAAAEVTWSRSPEALSGWQVKVDGRNEGTNKYPSTDINYVMDNKGRMMWLDHEDKAVRVAFNKKGAAAWNGYRQYFEPAAMLGLTAGSERLEGATFSMKPPKNLDGVQCQAVEVVLGDFQKETWYISPTDNLPRRLQAEMGPAGTLFIDFTAIDTGAVDDSYFKLDTPESYSTTAAPRQEVAGGPRPAGLKIDAQNGGGVPVDKAPDFALSAPDERVLGLDDFKGKVVVLDFWGTWCVPCRQAGPELQRLYEQYNGKGLEILALACRERSNDKPIEYFEQSGFDYQLLLEGDEVAAKYNVKSYPTYFVIDHNGVFLDKIVGWSDENAQKLEDAIKLALELKDENAKPGAR